MPRTSSILLIVVGAAACATVAPAPDGIPNLAEVDPGVYRGGQPTAPGWAWLVAHGVRTSIKLNYEPEGAPASISVIVASMPPEGIDTAEARPSSSAVGLALHALNHHAGAVFIHCDHGQDRTGLLVGLYRVLHDRWTPTAARAEMGLHGYHSIFLGLDAVWHEWTEEKFR